MKLRLAKQGLIKDDRAVALTEFCIVMPVLLLLYMTMLQYYDVARAAHYGNYAAYVAARSYTVLANQDQAQTAAALALAPIARLVPGELFNLGSALTVPGALQSALGNNANDFLMGYATALYLRLAGDNFSVSANDQSPQQVQATINYPQPLYLPGLNTIWNYRTIGGPSLSSSFSYGYGGIEVPIPLPGSLPYVHIQSKCWTGCETNWGIDPTGQQQWKPRMANPNPPLWQH